METIITVGLFLMGIVLGGFQMGRIEHHHPGWEQSLRFVAVIGSVLVPTLIAIFLMEATNNKTRYEASNCLTAKAYTRAVKSYYGISGNVEMPVLEHYRRGTLYWEVW